jgi:diguanylate cyclase (GGDEF)-like protein/PAS domain S-box-containing protein
MRVFPFHLVFTHNFQIVQVGSSWRSILPELESGCLFTDFFEVQLPSIPCQFEQLQAHVTEPFVLYCSRGMNLKGQMVYVSEQQVMIFLGSPWVKNIDTLQSLGLSLSDFGIHHALGDFLLLLQSQRAALTNTRWLATRLKEKQHELRHLLNQSELATRVLEQSADAIEITNAEAQVIYVNPAFEEITGYQREEVIGQPFHSIFLRGQKDSALYKTIWDHISLGRVWKGTYQVSRKDGTPYEQETTIFPVHNPSGEVSHYAVIKRDITVHRRTQAALEQSLSLLEATFEATADALVVMDTTGKILRFNRKFVDLWQLPEEVLNDDHPYAITQHITQCLRHAEAFSLKKALQLYGRLPSEGHELLELKDGRVLEWYTSPQRIHDSTVSLVWSFRDITERQQQESRIRHQALHDALTGLPNRTLFGDRLEVALTRAQRHKSKLAVMFLDLDRFKLINDSLGHSAGDRLLKAVSHRLIHSLRQGDTVARWAGDEFTLLLPDIHDQEDANTIAEKLLAALRPQFTLEGRSLRVGSSIGIAIYPDDGEDSDTLLKNADAALYQAKSNGRNTSCCYSRTATAETAEWLMLEAHLHHALERQEFVLYYQPQVNVVTGQITRMEALLRWIHPEMGMVSPMRFIPLAEETGLIVPLGEWVLQTACAQAKEWQLAGLPPVRVAVNLSTQQLRQPQFANVVQRILQETGLDAHYLELEITETAVMKNLAMTKSILDELHQMGVSIALDDFGTGYSSLSYLKAFPLQTLKIDQSFIRDLTTDPNDRAIVTAIIALGKVLNLNLVAEGVETSVQKEVLRSLDCQEMQGFWFSRPLSANAATHHLKSSMS